MTLKVLDKHETRFTIFSKQQTANSKQQTANSKQQTANSKQQTSLTKLFSALIAIILAVTLAACGGGGGGGGGAVSGFHKAQPGEIHNGGGGGGWGKGNTTGSGFDPNASGSIGESSDLLFSQMAALDNISSIRIELTINGVAQEPIIADATTKKDVLPVMRPDQTVSGTAYIYLSDGSVRVAQLEETHPDIGKALPFKVPYYYRCVDSSNTEIVPSTEYFARNGIDLSAYTTSNMAGWLCTNDNTMHNGSHVSGVRGDITLTPVYNAPDCTITVSSGTSTETASGSGIYAVSSITSSFSLLVGLTDGSSFPAGTTTQWQINGTTFVGTTPETCSAAPDDVGITEATIGTNATNASTMTINCLINIPGEPQAAVTKTIKVFKQPVIPAFDLVDSSSTMVNSTTHKVTSMTETLSFYTFMAAGGFPYGTQIVWKVNGTQVSGQSGDHCSLNATDMGFTLATIPSSAATATSSPVTIECIATHADAPGGTQTASATIYVWKPQLLATLAATSITALAPSPISTGGGETTITITGASGNPTVATTNTAQASLLSFGTPLQDGTDTSKYTVTVTIASSSDTDNFSKVWFNDDTTVPIRITDPSGAVANALSLTLCSQYGYQVLDSDGTTKGGATLSADSTLAFSEAVDCVGTDSSGRDIAAFKDTATNTVYKQSDFPITFNSSNFSKRLITLRAIPEFEFIPTGGNGDGSSHAGTSADPYKIKKDAPASNVNAYVTPSTICDTIEITADPPFSTHGILKVGTGTKIIQWESNPSAAAIDAMPAAGLTYEVTITDTGSGAYKTIYVTALKPTIGSKATPNAVGDIVFSDGSACAYTDTLTDDQKNAAIAVIFDASNKLGVGLKHGSNLAWCTDSANAKSKRITTIICKSTSGTGNTTDFSGDEDGSDNFEQIAAFLESNSSTTDDTATEANYPAFYFAKNYKDTATNLAGTEYEDGWYLPTIAEIAQIYAKGKGTNKVFDIDAVCQALGGNTFGNQYFLSSSQSDDNSASAALFDFSNCGYYYGSKSEGRNVCAVRKFD